MTINIHQLAENIASQLSETSCSQPFGSDCDVYKVFDKVFLMIFKLQGKRVINLKIEPQRGEMLRDFYPFIHVGYHMNKQHWISVYQDEAMDTQLMTDLVISSYELVVNKLNKIQKQRLNLLKNIQ